jgi:hypothetical protein
MGRANARRVVRYYLLEVAVDEHYCEAIVTFAPDGLDRSGSDTRFSSDGFMEAADALHVGV